MAFCQKVIKQKQKQKNLCHYPIFLEAFFIAPLFLDIYIEVFGALVNHTNISNSDIFKEDTAVFAKDDF